MSMPGWMLRHPNARSGRFQRNRKVNKDDEIDLNLDTEPKENIFNVLLALCQLSDVTDGKRLNYLNAFVKITLKIDGKFEDIGFTIEEILRCLRIPLLHESTQVRSGSLRAIRHVIRDENDIKTLNALSIPFLIARSLDLLGSKDIERIESLKLVRKILLISPKNFHVSLSRSLISLANGGVEEKDRMLRICLATLCELGLSNSDLFIEGGGVTAITRNLLECQTPKIAESLCGVLLLFLDKPSTRHKACIDLHAVTAPYCDFHYRQCWKDKDKHLDERELRFNCSRLALLTILRSWPGILHLCSPTNKAGLKAVVEALYLKQLEVRKAVLDLLYELLGLPQPEWTDELSVALSAVDPCEPQSSWRLNDGFVAAEGRSILPHLAKSTPSINDMHLSLLLYCFLECGLLGAIVEVIATSDTFISVRATVLLGELLHLIQVLIPPECCNISPALPSLLEYATLGNPLAVKAVNGLQQLQKMLKSRPASYSLYLDFILRSGNNVSFTQPTKKKSKRKLQLLKNKLQQLYNKDGDDLIKDTGVLANKDAYMWNWNLIRLVLKGETMKIDWNNPAHKNFVKRLVDFYTPSRNKFSHMDLATTKVTLAYTMTGIELISTLLESGDEDSLKLLRDLLGDICSNITAITEGRSVHDCLFSPQHMNSTQCQSYFLFLGRLACHETGISLLNALNMFQKLEHLATTTNNDCYVKLIVSSLDYNSPGLARDLLKSVLKCPVESSRLYATQFVIVLLRAGTNSFHDWGIQLLIDQLNDKSRSVQLIALSSLHEACEQTECLESLVRIKPDLTNLGERGVLLWIRLLSVQSGFEAFSERAAEELTKWDASFNYRYVRIVEGETSDALTLHQRDEDGKYDKRTSSVRANNKKDVFLPPHLYGQLGRHPEGSTLLLQHGALESKLKCLEECTIATDEDIMKIKASLWALGHFGSTQEGFLYLVLHNCLATIITLAQECPIYSVRATAYYVLGLLATTKAGADELFKLGWFCTRHNRHVNWPIIEEESWNEDEEDSLRIQYTFPSDRTSEMYFFDSGVREFEACSTDDDISESIGAMSGHQKSFTLPTNQNTPSSYHKRSLSESKTFEIVKCRSSFKAGGDGRRIRNNSTTESTTSGVSSCDSGGRSVIYEPKQILSPIPSSCSLSTLKQTGGKVRRHSESSRQISMQSGSMSDKSSHSMAGSGSNRLSHQDLIGYAILRNLRRSPRCMTQPSYAPCENDNESMWDITASLSEETSQLESSSVTVKRFSFGSTLPETEDKCYLGVALPHSIQVFFPNEERPRIIARVEETEEEFNCAEADASRLRPHDTITCLFCQSDPSREKFSTAKSDVDVLNILKLIEDFSNPIWCKQERQTLLLYKQRCPQVFQDPCLYSDVCKMLSECVYRLSPRRMLHELFHDVNYRDLYAEATKLLERKRAGETLTDQAQASGSNIKTLDSMNLAYKENKFPIRKRNESKIV